MTRDDVIDTMVGIVAGSTLDGLRDRRPEARSQAQASYIALFAPEQSGDVDPVTRFGLAYFVAGLHAAPALVDFYAGRLQAEGAPAALFEALDAEIGEAATQGPYGSYPAGPLSGEDSIGLVHTVSAETRGQIGAVLAAGLEHAHMLVFHPRDASPSHLQALVDAGWSSDGIVTLSQLVAFLAFQIRVVSGLATLARLDASEASA